MAKGSIEIRTNLGTLDLFQGEENSFYITRQIHDLQNFETRNADYSKTIRIPPTPNNLDILDAHTGIENRQTIPCQILMGGTTISSRASLLFTKSTINNNEPSFDVTIFYGNFNLFNDIIAGTIDGMNWADLQYEHTHTNYAAMSANLTGICTPVLDWLTRNSENVYPALSNIVEINTGGFFVYSVEIIDRILAEAGYTATYENVPAEFHQSAIACPVTKFFELVDVDQVSFSSVREKAVDTSANNAIVRVPFATYISGAQGLWNGTLHQWELVEAGEVTVEVRGTYTYTETGERPDSFITIYQNGNPIDAIVINDTAADVDFFLTALITGAVNDIIYCDVEDTTVQTVLTVNALTNFSIASKGVAADRSIQPSNYIPQIDKSEFIANILKLYNVIMETNDITKSVNFTSFNDVFTGEEQDLTRLLDVGDIEITKVNSIRSLGQISKFEWQNDNLLRRDMVHDELFENQQLAKEKTTISMIFSGCDDSIYLFGDIVTDPRGRKAKVPNCQIIKDTQDGTTTINIQANGDYVLSKDGELQVGVWLELLFGGSTYTYRVVEVDSPSTGKLQDPIAAPIVNQGPNVSIQKIIHGEEATMQSRLCELDATHNAGTYTAVDGSYYGGTGNNTSFPTEARSAYFGDKMLWSTIVEGEYKQILDALKTPEVVKAWFNLDVAIFAELDFLRPVYIQEFNAFYYINKIEQFKLNNKTRVELVRISALSS